MKLTLEHYDIKVTTEAEEDSTIDEVIKLLIIPSLLAIGFQPGTIEEYFEW